MLTAFFMWFGSVVFLVFGFFNSIVPGVEVKIFFINSKSTMSNTPSRGVLVNSMDIAWTPT